MGQPSWYLLEMAADDERRQTPARRRDYDSMGVLSVVPFASTVEVEAPSGDENPADDAGPSPHMLAVWELADRIVAGTAPADICARALKCAVDCAKITGRPVAQFLDQAAVSVAETIMQEKSA